jgi:hypothetical protein
MSLDNLFLLLAGLACFMGALAIGAWLAEIGESRGWWK